MKKARRLVLALGLIPPCFLPMATAWAQDSPTGRPPARSPSTPSIAHERLTAFEGTWRRIDVAAGRTVVDTCAWMSEGRRHMVCRQRAERAGTVSEQMAVYSYRGADSTYTLTVFLSGGQLWRYAGRAEGSRWTFYRQGNRPDAPSRLRQIVVASGDTLRFMEEVSEDGTVWRLSDASEDYRSVRVGPATRDRGPDHWIEDEADALAFVGRQLGMVAGASGAARLEGRGARPDPQPRR